MLENNQGIYLALGSNIGNRENHLQQAISEIAQIANVTKKSQILETKPVGYIDQNDFLNMVIEIETELPPKELLTALQEIETKLGRTRPFPNAPRTIDIDIILYKDQQINTPELTIPHPEMHNREFVLKPLQELIQSDESR